jgi:acyl-CoA reductase-like NAD-dependent aldehyde dehydrogenase
LGTTNSITSSVISASEDNVKYSIQKAHEVFQSGVWSKAPTLHRSEVLTRLARLLEKRIPEFAELEMMQTGRTIREMKAQLGRLPEWLLVLCFFQVWPDHYI